MSKVSVIVPCHNYGRYLARCVESVLSQEGPAVELLIIDDASVDETPMVVSRLAADPRVTVRTHSVNHGHIRTYNEGFAWATGDYTLLLSADDALAPGALGRAVCVLDADQKIGFVYGRMIYFGDDSEIEAGVPDATSGGLRVFEGLEWFRERCRGGDNVIQSPELLVRTRLQHELGGYSERLPHSADLEMVMRFAVRAPVARLDAVQAYARIHGHNMHFQLFSSRLAHLEHRRAAFDDVFRKDRDLIPRLRRFERLAARALTRDALWLIFRDLFRRSMAVGERQALMDFAMETYLGERFRSEGSSRRGVWPSTQVLRLTRPFLAAIARSSRGWVKARMRSRGPSESWWGTGPAVAEASEAARTTRSEGSLSSRAPVRRGLPPMSSTDDHSLPGDRS